MTATVTIDDRIFAEAAAVLHTKDPAQVINRALESLARPHAAQPRVAKSGSEMPPAVMTREEAYGFLATIGGSMPEIEMPRRRRVEDYQ